MKTIHFIGIGGIGVSALALWSLKKGLRVSGSDLSASEITHELEKLGGKVHIGKPKTSLVSKATEKVIYSPAIQENHPERAAARKLGILELSYPEALGELTRNHFTLAVSGTHGKSTTSSMLGVSLTSAGLDPTVIVGTKVNAFGNTNCRTGSSKYLVIEADEYADSFLNYTPDVAILTSLEPDHLDYFKSFENMKKSFAEYLKRLKPRGVVVANKDDANLRALLRRYRGKVVWYSAKDKEAVKVKSVLKIPGKHNVQNGLAVLRAMQCLKIPEKKILRGISSFTGSWRRFEVFELKQPKPYILVSDYGHHPTEIAATLEAAREKWPKKEVWLFYQPHQYQRTHFLFKDFVKVLSKVPVQKLLLLDIYDVPGREKKGLRKKVSSVKLASAIEKKRPAFKLIHAPFGKEAKQYLAKNLKGGEVVIVMGAGDIYQNLTVQLTRSLRKGTMAKEVENTTKTKSRS